MIVLDSDTGGKCLSSQIGTTGVCGIKGNYKGDAGSLSEIECPGKIKEGTKIKQAEQKGNINLNKN